MTEQEAKTVFRITAATTEASWEDAYQERVFEWRNYLLRQAVVPPLFQKRIHNLLRLEEASHLLLPERQHQPTSAQVMQLKAQAGMPKENPPLRTYKPRPPEFATQLPLESPPVLGLLKAYGNRHSLLKLGIAPPQPPTDIAAFAVALVSLEWIWIEQLVPLFAALAHEVAPDQSTIKAGQPIDPAEWIALNRKLGLIELSLEPQTGIRSEERRVGKECRSRWSP